MADLTYQVDLNIREAQRQIDALESQLSQLAAPIDIPVNIGNQGDLRQVRQELGAADQSVEELNRELAKTERELDDVGDQSKRTGQELERTGRRGTSAFKQLAGALTAVGAGVLAARGLRELAGFFGDSVMAASNLEQAIGGVESIFGDASAVVREFGQTSAQSVGLAESAFLSLSSQLGAQLQAFGFNAGEAANQTNRLVELSADLAATFGGPVSDAVGAVASLLRGEFNPIERFGVAMNVASIQAHALATGIIDTNRQLTIQERAVAALDLLYQQTTGAQGQFAREAGTTAGLMERLSAAFQDAQAEIGDALVPAVNELLSALPGLIDGLSAVAGVAGVAVGPLSQLAVSFAELVGAIPAAEADLRRWAIQSGRSASSAELLAGAFVQLNRELDLQSKDGFGQRVDDLAAFRRGVQDFLSVAETSPTELRRLLDDIGNLEEFLDPDQIRIIREELRRFLAVTGQFSTFSEADRFLAGFGAGLQDVAIDAGQTVTALDRLSPAFRENIGAIEDAMSAAEFDLSPLRDEIDQTIGQLPTALDAARSAMRDDQNEIVDDFSTFLSNLRKELAAQTEFDRNLNILENLGFGDLAAQFRELGFSEEVASLLAQAIRDPAASAEAEAAIDAYNDRLAEFWRQDLLQSLLSQVTDPFQIPINIEGILNSINIPGIGQGLIPNLQLGSGTPNLPPGGGGGGGGGGPNVPVAFVEQNFYTQPEPDTATERLKQAVRAI